MSTLKEIHKDMSIEETLSSHPKTIEIFHHYLMDTCCGAFRTIEEACKEDDVALPTLLDELNESVGTS